MRAENFIAFFTVCGFFAGVVFSALKLNEPLEMIMYTFAITLFFHLLIHIIIINYVDITLKKPFDKDEYEKRSDYLVSELGLRAKRMDTILGQLGSERVLIKQTLGRGDESNAKAA